MTEVTPTGEPDEETVGDHTAVDETEYEDDTEYVEVRPGDVGGVATVTTVTMQHDGIGGVAEVPIKSVPLWEEYGWVEVEGTEEDISGEAPITGAGEGEDPDAEDDPQADVTAPPLDVNADEADEDPVQ